MAALSVCSVSADDDVSVKYVQSHLDFTNVASIYEVFYRYGQSYYDLIEEIDNSDFSALAGNNFDVVFRDLNENHYYEYVSYDYYEGDTIASPFGVFSYSFSVDRVTLPWMRDVFSSVVLNDGFLSFYTRNAAVDGVRFSIRYIDAQGRVSTTALYSNSFDAGFSTSHESGLDRFYYYTGLETVSAVKFGSSEGDVLVPGTYVFCIDFFFRPVIRQSSTPDELCVGISLDSYFSLFNYTLDTSASSDSPNSVQSSTYRPELDMPYYKLPGVITGGGGSSGGAGSSGSFGDAVSSNGQSSSVDLSSALKEFNAIEKTFDLGFSHFTTAFLQIGDVFNHTTDGIPHLRYLFYFSLGLGLIAFLLGLSNSIFGASSSVKPNDFTNRDQAQKYNRHSPRNRDSTSRPSDTNSK